jgi:long-subunit fatty acid transport protein
VTKNILFRGGFAYTSSPYQNDINDGALYTYSVGLGYRTNSFFVDFAYVYKMSHQKYWFYDPSMVNPVHQNFESNCIVGTFGFKL